MSVGRQPLCFLFASLEAGLQLGYALGAVFLDVVSHFRAVLRAQGNQLAGIQGGTSWIREDSPY